MRFPYKLTISTLDVTTTSERSMRRTADGAWARATSSKTDVAVSVEADAHARGSHVLDVDAGAWKDTSVKLETTADGRISAVGFQSTGQGAELVSAVASVAGTVLGALVSVGRVAAVSALRMAAVPAAGRGEPDTGAGEPADDPESEYARLHRDEAARRASLLATIKNINAAIDRVAGAIASAVPAEHHPVMSDEIRELKSARTSLASDLDDLDEHFETWLAARYADSSTASYHLRFDQVGRIPGPLDELDPASVPRAWPEGSWFQAEGVAVAVVDPYRLEQPDETREDDALLFRVPRQVELRVYRADAPGGPLTCRDHVRANVVDEHSPVVVVPMKGRDFGELTVSVSTNTSGAIEKLSVSGKSFLADLATALGKAPAEVQSGLSTAQKLNDTIDTLRQAPSKRRTDDLEQRKKLIEDQIALAGVTGSRRLKEQLDKVNAELDLAKARNDLAAELAKASGAPS